MSTVNTKDSGKESEQVAKKIGIYTVGPEIGKGSFATVYKCINNVSIILIMKFFKAFY